MAAEGVTKVNQQERLTSLHLNLKFQLPTSCVMESAASEGRNSG